MNLTRKPAEFDLNDIRGALRQGRIDDLYDVSGLTKDVVDYRRSYYRLGGNNIIITNVNSLTIRPYKARAISRHYVGFLFLITGTFKLRFDGTRAELSQASVAVGINSKSTTSIPYRAGCDRHTVMIFVELDALTDYYGLRIDLLPEHIQLAFRIKSEAQFSIQLVLPPRCFAALDAIKSCFWDEPLRSAYVDARSQELICETVHQINHSGGGRYALRSLPASVRERQLIEAAAHIYRQQIGQSLPIDVMAKRIGLNRNKLNDGFKDLYGMGPGEYSRWARLSWAREQITAGLLGFKEIATMAGYANSNAFSRAYSDFFGHAPTLDISPTLKDN